MIPRITIIAGILFIAVLGFHLEQAKVIEKIGEFTRKRTKFGDVYLHREHEEGEEVVL
jgi:hypothetical protein